MENNEEETVMVNGMRMNMFTIGMKSSYAR